MLIPNHPADELLAAFADNDSDATDSATADHVASCVRCTATVDELVALRMALAEMPDLAPSRPLQLVPGVEPDRSDDRVGGWVRRLFGPVLVTGAAVALVGAVGTTAPMLSGMAGGQADSGAEPMLQSSAGGAPADGGAAEGLQPGASDARSVSASAEPEGFVAAEGEGNESAGMDDEGGSLASRLSTDRSPWPMVLFAGIALVIGALLMRWILVPRAG